MNDDRVASLSALYQAERADLATTLNVALSLVGIGTAYIIVAIGYVGRFGTQSLPWYAIAFAPIPLWIIAVFQSLLTLSAMMHSVSVQILENKLFRETGLPKHLRMYVGSRSGDEIMDFRRAHPVHTAAFTFVQAAAAALIVAFTVYTVGQVWADVSVTVRVAVVETYLVIMTIVGFSWGVGLYRVNKATVYMNDTA